MQKIFLYTVAIIFCLTSFHSSLAREDGILRQNDSLISVDETRRTEADNTQVVGRDVQPDPLLARFLWRDASPTALPSNQELQWSEQATLDPDQLLARFLWEEEPAKQSAALQDVTLSKDAQPQLARFLWRDATPTLLPSGPELQWSEQAPLQATLDPDHLLAGFYWQLRDYDEKQWPEEQDLARFLWDEAPAKQVDAPQLARFLWRDATPTLLPSGPELQWSEQAPLQGTLDPDHLLAGFYWQLRDYDEKQWPEEQDLAGFYWQLRDYDEKQWPEEQDLAGFYWQLRDYDEKQWPEEQDLAGFYWQLRDYDEKQWPEEQDLARFLWDEAPEKQVDAPQLARFLWRDATPTLLPSGPELQWSEQAPLQGTLDPDHLLAGFYWQLRDYDEKQWPEDQDLAGFLWDEAPEKQVDAPQLARFLWRDATPTLLPSGPELQLET